MSRQICELEAILQQMLAEHRKLLSYVGQHEEAIKAFDLKKMDAAARLQEASRLRIALLEQRRRAAALQVARASGITGELTVRKLAELHPPRAAALNQLRTELRETIEQITARTHVSGKVAGAVLGHLNTVVRLIAGVVEKAGLYTKNGIPRVSSRIGVMEAVG